MSNFQEIVIGGGCFWCTEAIFKDLIGVEAVESGYAGGQTPNPTYKEVCSGTTGHAEVIKVTYDPSRVGLADLLRVHLTTHDPTTLNRQGGDVGTQYRSVIFFATEEDRAVAGQVIAELDTERVFSDPIVTTLEPLTNYSRAEEIHQDYFAKFQSAGPLQKMTMNAGYCSAVVAPKVAKFRKAYLDRLKTTV